MRASMARNVAAEIASSFAMRVSSSTRPGPAVIALISSEETVSEASEITPKRCGGGGSKPAVRLAISRIGHLRQESVHLLRERRMGADQSHADRRVGSIADFLCLRPDVVARARRLKP